MSTAFVTNSKYLVDLFKTATPPPRPANLPKPPTPLNGDDSLNDKAVKNYNIRLAQWEHHMLGLDPEVGSDWEKWFGKAQLEKDWNARPRELEEDGRYQPQSEGFLVDQWAPDVRRKGLWRGVMVISFRKDSEMVGHTYAPLNSPCCFR